MRLQVVLWAFVFTAGLYASEWCPPLTEVVLADEAPSGMVWDRHGEWHLNGGAADLRLGEAIPSGGLLTAGVQSGPHQITVLLPDGQRLLCECYDRNACSQGFRIPSITPLPGASVWDMFVQVRNVLLLRPATAQTAFPAATGRAEMAGIVELVAAINASGEASLAPSLRVLPPGSYFLKVVKDGARADASGRPSTHSLTWASGQKTALVRVGDPGLYRIGVFDLTNVPRMEIEVLATSPATSARESAGLKAARETILGWNQTHGGWSLHDFLRVYLQAREAAILTSNQ